MELAILARLSAQQTPRIFYFCPPITNFAGTHSYAQAYLGAGD